MPFKLPVKISLLFFRVEVSVNILLALVWHVATTLDVKMTSISAIAQNRDLRKSNTLGWKMNAHIVMRLTIQR
ncbi:MAG TPA: hypothetical protein VGJ73_10345 [Verrucomicrobiae bacterium]